MRRDPGILRLVSASRLCGAEQTKSDWQSPSTFNCIEAAMTLFRMEVSCSAAIPGLPTAASASHGDKAFDDRVTHPQPTGPVEVVVGGLDGWVHTGMGARLLAIRSTTYGVSVCNVKFAVCDVTGNDTRHSVQVISINYPWHAAATSAQTFRLAGGARRACWRVALSLIQAWSTVTNRRPTVALVGRGTWSSLHNPQKPVFPAFIILRGRSPVSAFSRSCAQYGESSSSCPRVLKVAGMFVVFRRLGQT
jgi:hypothetical protein